MASPPQSPSHKKLKSTTEDADEETPMHIISSETQNSETQNRETQNNETQNRETQNNETQNNGTQNNETQNRETQNNETQNNGTQNNETQNRETQNSETQNREIPSEIILTKILPRLPASSLHRFKWVCKDWYTLISSSDFINDHAFRQNPLSSRSVLSIANDSSLTAINYGDLDFTPFGQYSSGNPIFLIGSSHGLVLLIATKGQLRFPGSLLNFKFDFRVFNPVLGGLGEIITPPPNFLESTHFVAKDYSFGFGYSSTHDEFYIVAINFLVSLNCPVTVVFLYNCSTKQWFLNNAKLKAVSTNEEQRLPIVLEDVWFKHSGTLVNEALHWGVTIGLNLRCIVGFDLGSKKLRLMNLPYADFGEPALIIRSAFSLCCLNDCLCAWAYSKGGSVVEMWMMKEYGEQKPWTRLFCADMESTYWYFFGLTKPREVMIFNFDGLRYLDFSCDTPICSKVNFQDQVKAVNYVQSLLPPHAIIKYPTSGEENK